MPDTSNKSARNDSYPDVAPKDLDGIRIIPLSPTDQERIVDILGNPPKLSRSLERAFEAHRTIISESR